MAQLSIRQDMESMLNMILLLAIVLVIRKWNSKFKRSIKYVDQALSRHNINLNEMVFHNDRQCVDNCRINRKVLPK